MKTDGNDNAFQEGSFGKTNTLTKREYFAAMALQGAAVYVNDYVMSDMVTRAVKYADMLVKELNQGKTNNE